MQSSVFKKALQFYGVFLSIRPKYYTSDPGYHSLYHTIRMTLSFVLCGNNSNPTRVLSKFITCAPQIIDVFEPTLFVQQKRFQRITVKPSQYKYLHKTKTRLFFSYMTHYKISHSNPKKEIFHNNFRYV